MVTVSALHCSFISLYITAFNERLFICSLKGAHLMSKHAFFSFLLFLVLNCNLPFVCEQEWSPSHNLKSLKKKQMAAREAMARQTVSDAEQSSVESSVIR